MTTGWFEQFAAAEAAEVQTRVSEGVKEKGYSAFYPIVEGFWALLRTFADDETERVEELLRRGRRMFPEPAAFSPSWEKLWDELEQVAAYKKHALLSVPSPEREGEWQIVMDNPYSNQEVVCYPALTFMEAAYLYGYFRQKLEKNEYIRLQKIQTLIMNYGE
ncbi:hypothetical protein [Gordoniibacillus kamchatkensis]|uniref:hypothetical protein n=1 Tax=Gordoniibacillus kamchatkensis TaxID=1590651 RepID=UPI0006982BC5|nr:hypothetical protein [Paenibacillus sp. VKM B-2647]